MLGWKQYLWITMITAFCFMSFKWRFASKAYAPILHYLRIVFLSSSTIKFLGNSLMLLSRHKTFLIHHTYVSGLRVVWCSKDAILSILFMLSKSGFEWSRRKIVSVPSLYYFIILILFEYLQSIVGIICQSSLIYEKYLNIVTITNFCQTFM